MSGKRINLHDLPAVKREMARVYREARVNPMVSPRDRMYMLRVIQHAIVEGDLELRLRALERQS